MKSIKDLKLNKSSVRILIVIGMLLLSVLVLLSTNGIRYWYNAINAAADDEPYAITDGVCKINNAADLIAYSQAYQLSPSTYQNVDIDIAITAGNLNELDGFVGIGTEQYPFAADLIIASSTSFSIALDKPFFEYIMDSSEIKDSIGADSAVTILRSSSADTALFAANVIHDGANDTPANWAININTYTDSSGVAQVNSFAGVIGKLGENAAVELTVNNNAAANGTYAGVSGAGDVGLVCCAMETGSKLSVSVSGTNTGYNVTSVSGNAGSFVGTMKSGSSLTIGSSAVTSGAVTGGYAGGFVGYAEDASVIFTDAVNVAGNISGTSGTGGVFGYYRNTAADREFDIANYNIGCTLNGESSGGIFGVLANGGSMSVITSGGGSIAPKRTSTEKKTYGGVIGSYSSDSTSNYLAISGIIVNIDKASGYAEYYGGVIGKADDDSYIKIENVEVNARSCNTNVTAFGGLAGYVNNAFIDAENVKINTNGSFSGGGAVGNMNSGVLRLGGTTDLSGASASSGGQIIGTRGNPALIYAKDGWKLIRSTTASTYDDIGTWGEVLRFGGVLQESDVLSVDETAHTVTIKAANTAVSGIADFAKLALYIQMNDGSASGNTLIFENTANTSAVLLASSITLSGDVDLSGTGITGLTRDDGTNAVFTGTFDGGNHTLTLAIGEAYGYRGNADTAISADDTSNGSGIIHRHHYNGLFAKTGDGAAIKNLTVDGKISIYYKDSSISYIGGLSAMHTKGAFTADNVTVNEQINYLGSGGNYNFAGGMIGNIGGDSKAVVTINDCTVNSDIIDGSSNSKFICSGAIGEISTSQTLTINAENVTVSANVTNTNTVTGKKVGGFISNISNYNGNPGKRTMSLKNITFDGASVTSATGYDGGALLGEAWNNMEVTVGDEYGNGITVRNSTVTQSGSGSFAGLITAATGYWQVYDINIESIKAQGTSAGSFGMLVNKGKNTDYDKTYALYLELEKENAFKIGSADLSLKSDVFFDELVTTCTGNYSSNTNAAAVNDSCAVVSIHTSGDKVIMDGTDCNTYQNQTDRAISNFNTRYYYNLDVMRAKDSAALSAPEKLMLWSVRSYAYDNVKNYFTNTFANNIITADTYDMTGYSYYPTDVSGVTVQSGSSFKFCNKEIEDGESISTGDNLPRTTSDTNSQHYLMHFGLFKNVSGDMTVNNITFSGNTGKSSEGSGALVCGTISGTNASNSIKITLNGVTLDGIKINGGDTADYAPLLINKIDSNTAFTLKNVKTTGAYTSDNTEIAATSLMGNVGGSLSDNIKITFSGLVLDGRKTAGVLTDLDAAYGTTRSIFSKATLLNSFIYPTGKNCTAAYNYKIAEDWGDVKHQVTYGKEISHSAEYTEEGMQKQYINSDYYTSPVSDSAGEVYDFSADFLPYAATAYDSAKNYHEIKVNHKGAANLDEGCGTYNDPYIIRTASQLQLVADMLNDLEPADGVIINYYEDNYKSWCDDKNSHAQLTWDSSNFVSEDASVSVDTAAMQQSLSTAYYKLENDIILPNTFIGIGRTVPFKGVIYGAGATVTNDSTNPIIYQSAGAVIKDLTVNVTADFSSALQENANSKYATDGDGQAAFYGGIIGIVNGGDNIIDNVGVTFEKSSTINIKKGSNYGNKAVGGYIGAVRYGGVIFRNMDKVPAENRVGITSDANSMFTSAGDFKDSNGKILLYCNPIIGRVIDGYAVNETTAYNGHEGSAMLQNGTKNYSIADINKNSTDKLTFNDKVITVPDSQSLFLMGCIAMSGAGSAGWNGSYTSGFSYGNGQMIRHADYSSIGDDAVSGDFAISSADNFDAKAVPYVIYKYTAADANGNYPARSLTKNDTSNCVFTIELKAGHNYDLAEGFRGIGSLNNSSDDLKMHISGLNGNGATISMDSKFYAYKLNGGYDQYYKANGSNNTNQNVGLGLFNNMVQKSGTVSDLTFTGNVSVIIYNTESSSAQAENSNAALCAGMLAGTSNNSAVNIHNVALSGATVYTKSISGGLIGIVYNNGSGNSSITDCTNINALTVSGGYFTGGLIGYICGGNEWTISNAVLSGIHVNSQAGSNANYGAGGLIGYKERTLTVDNVIVKNSTIEAMGSVGGLLGRANGNYNTDFIDCSVINTDIGSENSQFSGGILGLSHSGKRVNLTRCKVSGAEDMHYTIQGTYQASGLSSWIGYPGEIDGCVVENYDIILNSLGNTSETCGGFVSKVGNNIILKNSRISNCNIIRNAALNKPIAGIIGHINGKTMTGYNIAMDNVQIMDSEGKPITTGLYGDISAESGTVKLVGVCMHKKDGGIYAGKNFGNTTGYVICSDYNGACLDEANANKTASAINSGNNVTDMGAFPYATVNPKTFMGNSNSDKFLTGDGADRTAIDNILAEADTNKGYKNISSDIETFTGFTGKLSTFNEKTGAQLTNDFPVLVINETNYVNVTNLLNSYIHILTNDSSFSNYAVADSSKYNVEIVPYRLNEDSKLFVTSSEYAQTLECKNGYFRMTDNDYDSNHKQFTLIDIQYYTPNGTSKIAYHLYIPVYVEKMLGFDFRAAALSGTTYNTSFYTDGNPVLESYGTPVTAHITYSYHRTASEWQNAINGGENVLNGYGKFIILESTNDLPGDTKLVLVDKNNSDKAYYSTIGEAFTASDEKLDFSKFKNSDGTVSFSPVSLCDLLSSAADITAEASADGMLVKCTDADRAQATIRIGSDYYRKKTDSDTDTSNLYSVTVTAKENMTDTATDILMIDEEYYISFFTAADNSAPMRNITISCSQRLGDDNMTPSHMDNVNAKESMVHMILGNLYDQEFTFKTTGAEVINESNKVIKAELTTTVSLKSENAGEVTSYLNDSSIHLYHGFVIEAVRTDEDGTQKGVKGIPQVTGTYKIGDSEYSKNFSNTDSVIKIIGSGKDGIVDIKQQLIQGSVTITCDDLKILYSDEESIIAQFPERKTQDDIYGVTLSANSNLAYVEDNIEQSNISESKTDENGKSYYRENIAAASLSYNIPLNSPDEMTKLGINGRESNDKITAVGYYNVLNISEEDLNKAAQVQFTLSLYQKDADGDYISVNIQDHLQEIRLYDKNDSPGYGTLNGNSYDFIFNKDDIKFEAGLFEVRSVYSVITGAAFENGGRTYANYKVQLTAQLLDSDSSAIANSSCSDYIIYTNAKICTEMLSAG